MASSEIIDTSSGACKGKTISRMITPGLPDQAEAVASNIITPVVCHCLCTIPAGAEAASSFFYSTRIAELSEQRSRFDNQLEFDVESSTSHWTETVSSAKSDESDEQMPNSVVFETLKEHPQWGPFFRRQPYELEIGAKITEGGQAEIFTALGMDKYDMRCSENEKVSLVLKVFKDGFLLDHLQRLWPPRVAIPLRSAEQSWTLSLCWVLGAQLLHNGRFAFIFDRYWGDLRKLIDENMLQRNGCPPFDGRMTHKYILSIARGMHNLHKLGILHNDLKSANVFVENPKLFYGEVVVADFESSIGIEGTGFWRAPEILLALKNRKLHPETITQKTTEESDVYSFAMTCYEIITGRMPFEGHHVQDLDITLRGERPTLPSGHYSLYNNLVMRCWHQDPRQRPSFAKVMENLKAIDYSSWPQCGEEKI